MSFAPHHTHSRDHEPRPRPPPPPPLHLHDSFLSGRTHQQCLTLILAWQYIPSISRRYMSLEVNLCSRVCTALQCWPACVVNTTALKGLVSALELPFCCSFIRVCRKVQVSSICQCKSHGQFVHARTQKEAFAAVLVRDLPKVSLHFMPGPAGAS